MNKNSITQVPPNIWDEPYITPTKEDLQRRFKEYNEQYFDNVLPPCKVSLTQRKQWRGSYSMTYNGKATIHIPRFAYWTDSSLKLVLIHEMCHHYVFTIYKKRTYLFPHGRLFNKVCEMLRKKYGLKVKVGELPTVYYYKEKIPVTFWQMLRRKHLGPKF